MSEGFDEFDKLSKIHQNFPFKFLHMYVYIFTQYKESQRVSNNSSKYCLSNFAIFNSSNFPSVKLLCCTVSNYTTDGGSSGCCIKKTAEA